MATCTRVNSVKRLTTRRRVSQQVINHPIPAPRDGHDTTLTKPREMLATLRSILVRLVRSAHCGIRVWAPYYVGHTTYRSLSTTLVHVRVRSGWSITGHRVSSLGSLLLAYVVSAIVAVVADVCAGLAI
jgi:small-conductance mechanosensitive channel